MSYRNQKRNPSVMPVQQLDGRISSGPESTISEEDQTETSTALVCSTEVPSNSSIKTSRRHFKPLVKAVNLFVKLLTPSDNVAAREYMLNVGTPSFLGCEGVGSFIPASNSAYNYAQYKSRDCDTDSQAMLSELGRIGRYRDTSTFSVQA